ncbi:hypothetical protein [Brucella anthropi]|uniref:hypothetical protein n=1 Tax=Brucella anthropi TaxID=529 RepID=UPI0015FB986F|nr:hypothetical protein [Brucella anthropi]
MARFVPALAPAINDARDLIGGHVLQRKLKTEYLDVLPDQSGNFIRTGGTRLADFGHDGIACLKEHGICIFN